MQVSIKDVCFKLVYSARSLQKLVLLVVEKLLIDYHARLFVGTKMVFLYVWLRIVFELLIEAVRLVFCEPFL